MAAVTAPANLPELVRAAFVRARAAGDLTFFPTQVALLRVHGVPAPFQLRYAPALAKKPKPSPQPAASAGGSSSPAGAGAPAPAPYDPFESPPAGLVVVPQLGPSHRLVLNKFAICADHAILATTAFRPQHHLLDAADLAAAYACIEAYAAAAAAAAAAAERPDGEGLFVFYNSGRHSGASQPHRHLQLLPVARMREGLADSEAAAWAPLVDQLLDEAGSSSSSARTGFPYVAAARIRRDGDGDGVPAPAALHALYLDLYRQACAAAEGTAAVVASTADAADAAGEARISYNLALTRQTMALMPRTSEGGGGGSGSRSGSGDQETTAALSLNGTVLAGTALVKSAAEWDALRSDPAQLARILQQIGVPSSRSSSSAL